MNEFVMSITAVVIQAGSFDAPVAFAALSGILMNIDLLSLFLLALGCLLGIAALVDLRRRRCASGDVLMWRMARELGLTRADRRIVRALAQRIDVKPASLLISRGCFDHARAQPGRERIDSRAMDDLCRRLFD